MVFITAGFAAKPGAAEPPPAHAVNNDPSPGPEKTYRTSFDANGFSKWRDNTDIYENSVFYIQGIVSR